MIWEGWSPEKTSENHLRKDNPQKTFSFKCPGLPKVILLIDGTRHLNTLTLKCLERQKKNKTLIRSRKCRYYD